ncbi:MAG: N-acetylmuramoyl-L-alanine amidase, partial [Verrucomicrobiae bacterium]|nr:N-acetylmuramoyl-L-alanine amidase [Verrucomicrobiae bacterium]
YYVGSLLVAFLLGITGHADQKGHARVETRRAYVDLVEWARTNSFQVTWGREGREVVLTNRSWRLAFTANSRQMEINGVKTWLSFPITARGTNASIALLDVQTLVRPLLIPVKNKQGRSVNVIALDPGHGGKDRGYEAGGYQEKTHTLLLAQRLRSLLHSAGLTVILTRSSDTYVDLEERVELAKRNKADLLVSLHYNAAGQGAADAKGVECYCLTPAGAASTNSRSNDQFQGRTVTGNSNDSRNILLAYLVQKAIVSSLDVEDRGVRRARFAILRDASMPAILVEGGFMSEPRERRQLVGAERRRDLAQAIADGILDYKRIVERR